MLSGIDYFVVISYLIGIMILGYYFKKYVKDTDDYFLGGRTLPFWAIGMSIVVSDIGALDFVGVSGQAYGFGISPANFDWLGSVPTMLLAAFIFVPYFWKTKLYTIPEYLGRRYNDYVRTIASVTWIIFFTLNMGVYFWASGILLESIMGWPIWYSIIITAVVTGLYTYFGGITAVVMTDVVQMIIMFVGREPYDYSLIENSPCVNTGTPFFVWYGDTLINLSADEFIGVAPDMRAIESDFLISINGEENLPSEFKLEQNYPNPFNPTTKIKYSIPTNSVISNPQKGEISQNSNSLEISPIGRNDNNNVSLKIYDILGREVRTLVNQKQNPGNYEVTFDAHNLPSGIYFYKLKTQNFSESKKFILLK